MSDEPVDFERGTATIRRWLNYDAVATEQLAAELRFWADFWKAPE